MSERQPSVVLLIRWLPYTLFASDRAAGRLEPELIELRRPAGQPDWIAALDSGTVKTVNAWSIHHVMNALADRAVMWWRVAQEPHAKKGRPTLDEMKQWIATTRSLAERLAFAPGVGDTMRYAASRLERTLMSPVASFKRWPAPGTVADFQQRASVYIWGMDVLLRTVNEAESAQRGEDVEIVEISRTQLWPTMFAERGRDGGDVPFADYSKARDRVVNIQAALKPGSDDMLMCQLLTDVLTYPPTLPK